jgi:hypothetical protein
VVNRSEPIEALEKPHRHGGFLKVFVGYFMGPPVDVCLAELQNMHFKDTCKKIFSGKKMPRLAGLWVDLGQSYWTVMVAVAV